MNRYLQTCKSISNKHLSGKKNVKVLYVVIQFQQKQTKLLYYKEGVQEYPLGY